MASKIPKFTSFRPKTKELTPRDKETAPGEERQSQKLRKHEKQSKEYTLKAKVSIRSESRHEDLRRSHERDAEPSKLFFSDRRGDADIARYGITNKYDVPAYRRYGYGCILGLSLNRRIDRHLSTEKYIVVMPERRRRQERLLVGKQAAKGHAIKFIKFLETGGSNFDDDFVPLSMTTKRKREESEDGDAFNIDYRNLQQNSPARRLSDPDVQYESEDQADLLNAETTQRNIALVRKTREHPQDIKAWLALIEHQEAIMTLESSSSELKESERRHLADVRIAIYEQALQKISDQKCLVELYLGLLAEASKTWDKQRLMSQWVEILAKCPQSTEIWVHFLNFTQSSFTNFQYERCRATFLRCFETIQNGSNQVDIGFVLYTLVRLTSMIQEAGYQELAIAIWQALLEFHALGPTSGADGDIIEQLHSFEEFWDSEMPRIGELDAKGWKSANPDHPQPVPPGPGALNIPTTQGFHTREVEAIKRLRHPGRTTDDVGEDDPFHTILFSDIEPCLRIIPQGTPATLVLDGFLRFCHLPPLLDKTTEGNQHWLDAFLQPTSKGHLPLRIQANELAQLAARYSSCPVNDYQTTTKLLFDEGFPKDPKVSDVIIARRVLKMLATNNTVNDSIGEYLLAFESRFYPKESFRTAKQLLKVQSRSLRLYRAYGLVESRRGNSAKADQVYNAALSMQTDHPLSTIDSLQLFSGWIWEALHRGDRNEAFCRLLSPKGHVSGTSTTGDDKPDQAALLRARALFTGLNERALMSNDYALAVLTTSLLAVLAYLSNEANPDNALSEFDKLSIWLSKHKLSQSTGAELHAQSIAHFLIYHATHASIIKPSFLRKALEPLIASFPNNTMLLSLYAANEARFSVDDRVRRIMHQHNLSNSGSTKRNIAGWHFAIHYEMLRGEIAGSTSHSIRALFKKAEEDVGAHCPALWTQNVVFEIDQARKERQKRPAQKPRRDGKKRTQEIRVEEAYQRARDTFFDGVRHLPWCKDFMMMAFTHLGEEFLSEEELQRVHNVMVDKGLRLYIVDEPDM